MRSRQYWGFFFFGMVKEALYSIVALYFMLWARHGICIPKLIVPTDKYSSIDIERNM